MGEKKNYRVSYRVCGGLRNTMESNQCISIEESSGTPSSPAPALIRCLAQYKMTGEKKKKKKICVA